MRALSLLYLCLCTIVVRAQNHLLLNEVQTGNKGITTDSAGRTPDWIEVYNPTGKAVDLNGWRIAMAGRQHVFTHPIVVATKSYRVLWCDGRTDEGPDHIAFKLAREGGALLLIAPDGITIADVFSYPEVPGDVSIGRYPDAAKSWSFFATPTPGRANHSEEGSVRHRWVAPTADHASGYHESPFELALFADPAAVIHFTSDGSEPSETHGAVYSEPLSIEGSTTVRAITLGKGGLASAPFSATYLIGQGTDAIALAMAPADLWDDSTGIYTTGAFNNNTRSGEAWEREGVVQWVDGEPIDVAVRISGSGSRGARKRSFKLFAAEGAFTFADGTELNEAMLRADAAPHAWLRNATLEELVRRHALHVEVQPSRTAPLYLNAAYWGLYRWMPGKDASWLRQLSGAEALDVLEGPAASALSGNDAHYERSLAMLLRGAPMDSLETMIDLGSLIDLACVDLWTGRADHELNVRCYRPREKGGRWRWVLYDMDLWAPANENSAQRMGLAAAPETPFVPQLLAQAELQERLLARITALQATAFAQAPEVADSLHRAHADELMDNYRRWELELEMPHPDSSLDAVKGFAAGRPVHLFAHLARSTARKTRTVTVDVPPSEQATVLMDGLVLKPGRQNVRCFSGVRIPMEVRPRDGYEFAGWKGTGAETARRGIELYRSKHLRPLLRAIVP